MKDIVAPQTPIAVREWIDSSTLHGAVSVMQKGQVLLECVRGWANRETRNPNRIDTRFATASVGKMFTAVCLARLVDAGLCRFDQPLIDLAPQLRNDFDRAITIESLLSQRSGLGDYIDDDSESPFAGINLAALSSLNDFLPYVLAVQRGPAGTFRYSNAGYILLGIVIESLTGKTYSDAVHEWVMQPAGMYHTGFQPPEGVGGDSAIGYLPDGRPNHGHLPGFGGPDGGIVTNVADLKLFNSALRTERLLKPTTRDYLFHSVSRVDDRKSYGHGFYLTRFGGEVWPGHTGSDPGVSARVAFSLEDDSSIVILCNVESQAFTGFLAMRDWLIHESKDH